MRNVYHQQITPENATVSVYPTLRRVWAGRLERHMPKHSQKLPQKLPAYCLRMLALNDKARGDLFGARYEPIWCWSNGRKL